MICAIAQGPSSSYDSLDAALLKDVRCLWPPECSRCKHADARSAGGSDAGRVTSNRCNALRVAGDRRYAGSSLLQQCSIHAMTD
jgi:hypothetical protein